MPVCMKELFPSPLLLRRDCFYFCIFPSTKGGRKVQQSLPFLARLRNHLISLCIHWFYLSVCLFFPPAFPDPSLQLRLSSVIPPTERKALFVFDFFFSPTRRSNRLSLMWAQILGKRISLFSPWKLSFEISITVDDCGRLLNSYTAAVATTCCASLQHPNPCC